MSSRDDAQPSTPDFLSGGGEMGALMRSHAWSASPLGESGGWPQPLKTLVGVMLAANQPMFIAWGPERALLYNDSYSEILAAKHPEALGRDFLEVWHEIRADLMPIVEEAYAGRPVHMDDIELVMERKGYPEEAHFAFSYTPVRDDSGAIAGFFCPCVELTEQVLAERRRTADAERQRGLFEQAPGFITILKGPEHVFEFANAAYRRLFGDRDYIGKSARDAFPELGDQAFFELLDRVYQTGERFVAKRTMIRIERSPGTVEERFLDFIYEPVTDEAGRVTGIFCEGHDVTDAHRAEVALGESEARLRLALNGAKLGTWDWDLRTLRGSWSPRTMEILGVSDAEEVTAARRNESVHPEDRERVWHEFAEALQSGGELVSEYRVVRPDGEIRWIASRGSIERNEAGVPIRAAGVVIDVTERALAEAALRDSEARYRTLFEAIESGFCVVEVDIHAAHGRTDYRVMEANPAFYRQTGFPEAIVGRWLREASPDLEEHWYDIYGRVARTGNAERFEQRSDMLGRWFDVFAFRVGQPEERRVGILFNDISARRSAEERLRELNEQLEQNVAERTAERNRVWEMSRDLFAIMGFDGHLKVINPAWETTFGHDAATLLSLSFRDQVHPDDHCAVEAMMELLLRGETVERFEDRIRHADGSWRWISWTLVPEGDVFYAVGRDVTLEKARQAELEAAQEALRQSQKLESMGQLTGGVAHDVNNLLTPIMGSLDMLRRRSLGGEREQRMIDGALQSAERAKVLVQRLLAFARRQPLQPVPVDVGALIEGMAALVASTSGPRIRVELDIASGLPAALADPNQVEMALLNLAVNARDAMPDGGRLTITAKPAVAGAAERSLLRPGQYVRLSVADTGFGMNDDTLRRAIEPFFSTKGIGKGTGLGLSMVHGLAAQLGGALDIQSKPGLGTCVELWLPVSREAARASDQPAERVVRRATGTALLVDDEELVRMSTADMLADLGYAVVEANSAEEALRLIESGLGFDLLITDHLMAGMTGTELARELRARRPDTPVLVVSGYAEVEGLAPDLPRLTKPFRRDELADSLAVVAART